MSIDRVFGKIVLHCDECDDYLETDSGELTAANKVAKEEGWRNVRDGKDAWRNLCETCYQEWSMPTLPGIN